MIYLQTQLRKREQRKKEDEEREKKRKEDREKAKELLQYKYQSEIKQCNHLIELFKGLNVKEEEETKQTEQATTAQPKVVQDETGEELKPLIGKNAEFRDEPVVSKKKKQDKKKVDKVDEKKRILSDHTVLSMFYTLNLVMPTNDTEIDNTIKQLNEKIEYFLKLREEEIKQAEEDEKEGRFPGRRDRERNRESDRDGHRDRDRDRDREERPERAEKKKKVLTEDDFPKLE